MAFCSTRTGLVDDGVITGARGVHSFDSALDTGLPTVLRGSLENQDDAVVVQIRIGNRLVESSCRARAITPPTGRPTTDHIGAVDNEYPHT